MDPNDQYKNGHWVWDEIRNGLQFIDHDAPKKIDIVIPTTQKIVQKAPKQIIPRSIRFKESIEAMDKIFFRKYLQRRVKFGDPDVITIQDIKDVALFIANPKDLTSEFISYFHTREIDRLLKSIIIYFHYYLQVWDDMLLRREEAKSKLRQPIVTILENIVMADLSDLRSMFAREYCGVISGVGDMKTFHHLSSSTNSLSDKDRRLFEALTCIAVRVAWIALQRRYLSLIDLELNRLLRTDFFNTVTHRGGHKKLLERSSQENRVLEGTSNIKETKLKQKSALVLEFLHGDHDYRMLGIGNKKFTPTSERILYLEKMFAAPEEFLLENGITIGLVGIPREEYDCMMYPRERTSKNFDKINIAAIDFKLPLFIDVDDCELPTQYPKEPCEFVESPATTLARQTQCKIWNSYIRGRDRGLAARGSELEVKVQLSRIMSGKLR